MVNYCVCAGCKNTVKTGHRVHFFPKSRSVFRAWVNFVRTKRADFSAASVSKTSVICSAHFTEKDYAVGDLMSYKMGFKTRVRLVADAVPTVYATVVEAVDGGQRAGQPRAGQQRARRSNALMKREVLTDKHRKTPGEATEIHESEDMRIKETFCVKQDETEEQTKMEFIKGESEEMKIEETFSVKQEETEEQTNMVFIKEESEDVKIEETLTVKHEETEEQTVDPEMFKGQSPVTTGDSPVKRKRLRTSEWLQKKRDCNRAHAKTRINIGRAFERWRELRVLKGFKTDAETAFFLLDRYERTQFTSTPRDPNPPPSLSSIRAQSDRETDFSFGKGT